MKFFSTFASLTGRRALLMIATIALCAGSMIVHAQTCPAMIGQIPLSNPGTAGVSCTTTQGRTVCSVWCTYTRRRGESLDTADIKLLWVKEKLRPDAPVLEDSCTGATRIPNGSALADKQALVRWASSMGDLERDVSVQALHLLNGLERSAAPCREGRRAIPPADEGCTGRLPRGRVRSPVGLVEVYSHAFDKWKGPITSEWPLYACDFVRTGRQSSATVFIFTPSGLEDRVDVMADTIMEVPGLPENADREEPGFVEVVKGTIRSWFGPAAPERHGPRPINVRTPTIVIGTRGTDFIVHHDPVKKQDFVFLNSGKIEVSAGDRKIMLQPGQQIFTENGQLSSVYRMDPAVWASIVDKKPIVWTSSFTTTALVSPDGIISNEAKDLGKTSRDGQLGGRTGQIFTIAFRGRNYRTLYESQLHEGRPIEIYFFEIIGPDGREAIQAGSKLWGRFVKQTDEKGSTTYWFVDWIFRGGRWEVDEGKTEAFTPVKELAK